MHWCSRKAARLTPSSCNKAGPTLRELNPDQRIYTFWHYMRNRFARDAGLRLDHLLLSPELAKRLTSARVDRALRGEEGASDHAPVWIELA
jgi:exodeoxyribonuclease-3